MDPALESRIQQCLTDVKVPEHYDRVYKDECMFSFDTPLSPGGLFLNLKTLQSFGDEFVDNDFNRDAGFPLYLHQKWTRVLSPSCHDGTRKLGVWEGTTLRCRNGTARGQA